MKKRTQQTMTEEERKFYAGFKPVVNQMPAHAIAGEFGRKFLAAAKERYGDIVTNDRTELLDLADDVLTEMRDE